MCLAFLPKLPIAYVLCHFFQTVARVTEAVKARPGLLEALETTVLPKKVLCQVLKVLKVLKLKVLKVLKVPKVLKVKNL